MKYKGKSLLNAKTDAMNPEQFHLSKLSALHMEASPSIIHHNRNGPLKKRIIDFLSKAKTGWDLACFQFQRLKIF